MIPITTTYITLDSLMLRTPKITSRSELQFRLHNGSRIKNSPVRSPKNFTRSKCEIEVKIPGVMNKKFSADPSELSKWDNLVYYLPLVFRPREEVDSQFISKLEPNPTDTRLIATLKETLLKHYQDKYSCNVLKWSPHFWSGQLVRWGFCATAGFRMSGMTLTGDFLECLFMAGIIPGFIAALICATLYDNLEKHRTYQCLSKEIEKTKIPLETKPAEINTNGGTI